jgi:hypothetical protein
MCQLRIYAFAWHGHERTLVITLLRSRTAKVWYVPVTLHDVSYKYGRVTETSKRRRFVSIIDSQWGKLDRKDSYGSR